MNKVNITEYLTIDLQKEMWCCNRCNAELISAKEPYYKGMSRIRQARYRSVWAAH